MVSVASPPASVTDNIARITERKHIPYAVMLELTYHCNEKCIHCYRVERNDRKELRTQEWLDVIDQLADAGTLQLTFTGGEIMVRKDFFTIAEHARKRNFMLILLTTGTLITSEAVADRIAALNPWQVHISMYAAGPQIHDFITKVPGSFERSLRALKWLKERGIVVKWKTPLMNVNVGELEKIIALAEELGVPYAIDPTISPKNDGSQDVLGLRVSDQDLRKVLGRFALPCEDDIPAGASRDDVLNMTMCKAGVNFGDINPYGDVQPCVAFPIVVGNLREQPFREIWREAPLLQRLRTTRNADVKGCNACALVAGCNRCPGMAYLEDGDPFGPSSRAGKIAKMKFELRGV